MAKVPAGLPERIFARAILAAYGGITSVQSWGSASFFQNSSLALARGTCHGTLKNHKGENDRTSTLDRSGVHHLSVGVGPNTST